MVDVRAIADAVEAAVASAAVTLRPDVEVAMRSALAAEPSPRGRAVLQQLLDNAAIAARDRVPLCQDTGTAWVRIELGDEECLDSGADLSAAIDAAVARAYEAGALRMSVVRDALFDRANTGTNAPAFLDVIRRPGTGATVTVMLKGGGSDNASRLVMLDPADGPDGVRQVVLDAVRAKAPNACPPLVVGVGVGGTFDTVAKLSKLALLRPVGTPAASPVVTEFEAQLLAAVNDLGIGPAGFGGRTTALAVHVITAPCHIAALPVAVNMGCSAVRSAIVEIR